MRGGGLSALALDAACETAVVPRQAAYSDSWSRTQLSVITQVCAKILVSARSVPTELQHLCGSTGPKFEPRDRARTSQRSQLSIHGRTTGKQHR